MDAVMLSSYFDEPFLHYIISLKLYKNSRIIACVHLAFLFSKKGLITALSNISISFVKRNHEVNSHADSGYVCRITWPLTLPHALKNKVYFKRTIPSLQRIYNQLHAIKSFYFNELFIAFNWKIHFGLLNTVQYTVIYELTNNKNKTAAYEFRMSQIMFFTGKNK